MDEAAALVAGYEIVPKEPIAQKALPECNITFISEMCIRDRALSAAC